MHCTVAVDLQVGSVAWARQFPLVSVIFGDAFGEDGAG